YSASRSLASAGVATSLTLLPVSLAQASLPVWHSCCSMPSELQEIEMVTSARAPAERLNCAMRVVAARATIRSICSSLVLIGCPPPLADQRGAAPRCSAFFTEYLPL